MSSTESNSTLVNSIDKLIEFITNYDVNEDYKVNDDNKEDNSYPDEITTSWYNNNDDESKGEDEQTKILSAHGLTNITTFYRKKHIDFILRLQKTEESYEYCQTEHLRMQVLYWALCCLDLCKSLHFITSTNTKQEILQFIEQCWIETDGGFGGNINHDVHLLNTLSAIQILYLLDAPQVLQDKKEKIIQFIASLQNKQDGSFMGDKWGEIDTRFTYAALNALSLLDGLHSIDIDKCKEYLTQCRNFDGGYGTKPGAESHSGMIFCCVASLAIINAYDIIDIDVLNWWLCERQVMKLSNLDNVKQHKPLNNGGLNGRPMKLPDVCYSWWCLSAMKICNKISWINKKYLIQFILNAQDVDDGGISDRPGDLCDIYHTYFGIGGLSLLGCTKEYYLKEIDPIWALPRDLCRRIGLYDRHKYADINYEHDIIQFASNK